MTITEALEEIKGAVYVEDPYSDNILTSILKDFKSSVCKQQRENCAKEREWHRGIKKSILNAPEPE